MTNTQRLIVAALLVVPFELHAQPPAYDLRIAATAGGRIGSLDLSTDARFDAPALGEQGEAAFVARWGINESEKAAVLTANRVVANEGDVIGGHRVAAIPYDARVAINASGLVAFEALYADSKEKADAGDVADGIFAGNRLALTRSMGEVGKPFILSDDGTVTNGGNAATPVSRIARNAGRIRLPRPGGISLGPLQIPIPTPPAPGNTAEGQSCHPPELPLPRQWSSEITITSSHSDPLPKGSRLESLGIGETAVSRRTFYGSDCRAVVIAFSDASGHRLLAAYTAHGRLFSADSQGRFTVFSGIALQAMTNAFSEGVPPIRINHRGQVLMPASIESGAALILATPIR